MMGMGQQMPMRRPPTGPSQMTAGRPNPMAGFQGGPPPMGGFRGPGAGGGGERMAPNFGGGGQQMGPFNPAWRQGYPGAQGVEPQYGGGPQVMDNEMPSVAYPQGGPQGMSDAMMHPFAPRNRPQFPGAAMRGIMGAMGGGPQMTPGFQGTGQLAPPNQQWMKPWEMRRMQNAIPL